MIKSVLARTIALLSVSMGAAFLANAQTISSTLLNQPTQSDTGGAGLIQMPSARMSTPGEFHALYYDNDEYRRMALSLQLLPWLESTIRYTDVRNRLYSPVESFSGKQTYKDRGLDIKVRLIEESRYLPEFSIGLKDIAGTGRFAGEFIAASKRFGNFDVTLGLGFGYLGERSNINNPFCEAAERFCSRDYSFEEGGDFRTDNWFAGNAAVFGGIEYQTPWAPLVVKAEYDGNDYSNDFSSTPIVPDSPWNFAAHYRVSDNFNVQLSYERGNTAMFGFNFRTNFNTLSQVKTTRPVPGPQAPSVSSLSEVDIEALKQELFRESGIFVTNLDYLPEQQALRVFGYQGRYRNYQMAIDRASAVLANRLPSSISEYRFVEKIHDLNLNEVRVDAQKFKRAHYRADFHTTYADAYRLVNPNRPAGQSIYSREHELGWPNFGVRPFLEQSFGSPENFYMYQFRLDGYLKWTLMDSLRVDGILSAQLLTNYDEFNFLQEINRSDVPRVRTYVREYVTQSDLWLNSLQLTYFKQFGNSWFGSLYGGYLERMFGGVGAEVLYRPLEAGWALGAEINRVKQRSFESHLGFRKYEVTTGHISAYYEPDLIPGTMFKLSLGRFLAGDDGGQLQFEKKFDSGIVVGAYAALTDISAEEYGEGSFTKGFYVSIPFDLFQSRHSAGRGGVAWTPLTRDGGQQLQRSNRLFGVTEARGRFYSEWKSTSDN